MAIVHGEGLLKAGTDIAFTTIGFKIDALKTAGKIETVAGKNILGITNFAAGKIAGKIVEKATSPKLANNKHNAESGNYAKAFFKNAEEKEKEAQKKKAEDDKKKK